MADPGQFSPDVLSAARTLALDWAAGVAVGHLRAAGIGAILLKGAGLAAWLYDDGEVRPYRDVDLLVSPSQLQPAKAALVGLGYVDRLAGADPAEFGVKEQELFGPNDVCIDLHHGLIGVTVPGERCWAVLSDHTTSFRLAGGAEAQILDVPARTMHLALHAAQNGPIDRKALADLERGVDRVGLDVWRDAARLARELGAEEAFAAGLRLVSTGEIMANRLSLTRRMGVELTLRTNSAPQNAIFFVRVTEAAGLRRKAALVARKVFPTAAYLQSRSRSDRASRVSLMRAWLDHLCVVLGRLGPSLVAWHKARLDTRSKNGANPKPCRD